MSAPCLSRPLLSAGPLQTLSREAGLAKPEPGLSEKGKGWNGSGPADAEPETEGARNPPRRSPSAPTPGATAAKRRAESACLARARLTMSFDAKTQAILSFLQAQAAAAQKTQS